MFNIITPTLKRLRFYRKCVRMDGFKHLSFKQYPLLFGSGFSPESIILHDLDRNNCHRYLSDLERHNVSTCANRGFHPVLHNKIVFHAFFGAAFRLPPMLAVVYNGKLLQPLPSSDKIDLEELLERHHYLVLKPLDGGRGRGLYFVTRTDGSFEVNSKPYSRADLTSLFANLDSYLVSKRIFQHDNLQRVYPRTSNVTRVVTMRDPDTRKTFIAAALQRFGTHRSFPNDSFADGALGCPIDIPSGRLSIGFVEDTGYKLQELEDHPDSGVSIKGLEIPFWEDIKSQLLITLDRHPYFDYVGWDLLIDNEGFYIIEGNHNPGIALPQVVSPMLDNPKIARFLRHSGIIKNR